MFSATALANTICTMDKDLRYIAPCRDVLSFITPKGREFVVSGSAMAILGRMKSLDDAARFILTRFHSGKPAVLSCDLN